MSEAQQNSEELANAISALKRDYSSLSSRIRTLEHSVASGSSKIQLNAHYLAFRGATPAMAEFINLLRAYLIHFCLPRSEVGRALSRLEGLPDVEKLSPIAELQNRATDLFKRAQKATNRNGEVGELIAYLMMESALSAPQLIAKMSLKTDAAMHVHGSDGVHVSFNEETNELTFVWGEAKCYKDVSAAIKDAISSVADNLTYAQLNREISLVRTHIDLSGLSEAAKNAILEYLDPFSDKANARLDASACLIAFDFQKFEELHALKPEDVEGVFAQAVRDAMPGYASTLKAAVAKHGLADHRFELFFLPVPCVQTLRDTFQEAIGWK